MNYTLGYFIIFLVVAFWIAVTVLYYCLIRMGYAWYRKLTFPNNGYYLADPVQNTRYQQEYYRFTRLAIEARHFTKWAGITYLLAGFLMALTFKLMTPPTSLLGLAYLTVIWPVWIAQDVTGFHPTIFAWCFDFG